MPRYLLIICILVGPWWPVTARGIGSANSAASDRVLNGEHWRLRTPRGIVHVWRPDGYAHHFADIVIYQHGYASSADRSWKTFNLVQQFRASRRNALFIVPDGPRRRGHRVRWTDLDALLKAVGKGTGIALPEGKIAALGHSAAFRTLAKWIDHPRLRYMALLDALYGRQRQFADWLGMSTRKMVLIAAHTRSQADRWVRRIRGARYRRAIPRHLGELSERDRKARLLYFRSQYEHSQIIRIGTVLPLVLRLGHISRVNVQPMMVASASPGRYLRTGGLHLVSWDARWCRKPAQGANLLK